MADATIALPETLKRSLFYRLKQDLASNVSRVQGQGVFVWRQPVE